MMTGVIPFATAILSVALMMSVILLLGLGGSADPQQRYLRLEGHVRSNDDPRHERDVLLRPAGPLERRGSLRTSITP